jgi:hypothetical protein
MHSALTRVQVLVTRTIEYAHWLANFCWGLHFVTEEKGKAAEISYSDARSLVTFSRGFILWQQGTCFYVWLWYKREGTSKHSATWLILGGCAPRTNQIASCFDALSITLIQKPWEHLILTQRSRSLNLLTMTDFLTKEICMNYCIWLFPLFVIQIQLYYLLVTVFMIFKFLVIQQGHHFSTGFHVCIIWPLPSLCIVTVMTHYSTKMFLIQSRASIFSVYFSQM